MSIRHYKKPPLTYPQLIQKLKDRGLTITNEEKALHLLKNISYYRLSGYWYPLLQDKENHVFKPGSTFETAFKLYCFDRELRLMVMREIEKIEVAVRSQMNHLLADYKGVYWFMDKTIFKDINKQNESLKKFEKDYKHNDEQFVKAFRANYKNPYPPCWMMLEVTSFGSLSIMYKNLKSGRTKREVANYFGLDDGTFSSWLHTLVYLRNVCAHHNRLWNRIMGITPNNPRTPAKKWLNHISRTDKSYFILSMIIYLLNTVNPKHSFTERFAVLLDKYPNVDTAAMGFPENWPREELWRRQNHN